MMLKEFTLQGLFQYVLLGKSPSKFCGLKKFIISYISMLSHVFLLIFILLTDKQLSLKHTRQLYSHAPGPHFHHTQHSLSKGAIIQWSLLNLPGGLFSERQMLPGFIEWGTTSLHLILFVTENSRLAKYKKRQWWIHVLMEEQQAQEVFHRHCFDLPMTIYLWFNHLNVETTSLLPKKFETLIALSHQTDVQYLLSCNGPRRVWCDASWDKGPGAENTS